MKLVPHAGLVALALAACQQSTTTPPQPAARDAPRADVAPRADAGVPDDALTPSAIEARLAPEARLTPYGSSQALVAHLRLRTRRFRQSGDLIGDAFGAGGLGEGSIGMGSLGSVGHGAGTGSGQGYGSGAGRALGAARAPVAPGATPASRVGGEDSITNNQVEGVDEGDIVKAHGDHLVILRRGRLLTVRLGGDALTPVSKVNAWGEGRPAGGWYDEMLVDGDTVVVIGYSHRAQATEVGLFDLSAGGVLRWRDTMFVRSSDYYSSRNYASRLVGHHLVMYMPVPLRMDEHSTLHLPAVRHGLDAAWNTVVEFDHLYRPVQPLGYAPAIHTVMSCDLSGRGFDCRAVGAVGPGSRNFYVSGSAVYLWVGGELEPWVAHDDRGRRAPQPAVLYRFPLDCGAPGAARVRGAPIDQFSFDERGGSVNVLLAAAGEGESMWGAEAARGDVGLVSVPLAQLTAAVPTVAGSAYKGVGRVPGDAGSMHNRFVGEHVLFGVGSGWRPRGAARERAPLFVHHVPTGVTTQIAVPYSVERIEPLGRDALVVGHEGGDLTFSAVALDATPVIADRHTVRGASQGETRSHGFFFAPSGDRAGVMGLPITRGGEGASWTDLGDASSAVVFLGVNALTFRDMGSLRSGSRGVNDQCVASCADWYGNARPVFWQGRTFALMGYELVEGTITAGRMRERRRTDVFRALAGGAGGARTDNPFDSVAD